MRQRFLAILLASFLIAAPLSATWSIVVVNLKTGEVAVGVATCVTASDLRESVPLILPEYGAAAHQSAVDVGAPNRMLNWELYLEGMPVEDVLQAIRDQDNGKRWKQIGLVSLRGDTTTFSGTRTGAWAGGVTGQFGDYVYAIQGNVLTGEPVVNEAEQALIHTAGNLPEKLMASMEAAALMGGDGRCSCSTANPTSCGAPPASFTKTAHIGTMLIARPGDARGTCNASGCGIGDYFMVLNVAYQSVHDDDAVLQLRPMFDTWKADLAGRPDAYRSTQWISHGVVPSGGAPPVQVVLDLADLEGTPIGNGGATITLEHDPRSAGGASLLQVHDHGDGTYTLDVQPGAAAGVDRLRVVVDDGIRPVTLWPPLELVVAAPQPGPWNTPALVAGLDGAILDAELLADGLVAWLLRSDGLGGWTLERAERANAGSPFGAPALVSVTNAVGYALDALAVCPDELEILVSGTAPGETVSRLYRATRATTADDFEELELVAELDTNLGESDPAISADGRELLFSSSRDGDADLFTAWRHAPGNFWMPAQKLGGTDAGGDERAPFWMQSATRIGFVRDLPGGAQAYLAERRPGGLFAAHPLPGSWNDGEPGAVPVARAAGSIWLAGAGDTGSGVLAMPAAAALTASGTALSAASGGRIDLTLDAGAAHALDDYILVCGDAGSARLRDLGDVVLPLRRGPGTALCLSLANSALLPGFTGTLDARGAATAALDLPPGAATNPALLDREHHFAFVTADGFVSNAVSVRLDP